MAQFSFDNLVDKTQLSLKASSVGVGSVATTAILMTVLLVNEVKEEDQFKCYDVPKEAKLRDDCYDAYNRQYNPSKLPLYGYTIINVAFVITVYTLYRCRVYKRIGELKQDAGRGNQAENQTPPTPAPQRKRLFRAYITQVISRLLIFLGSPIIQCLWIYPMTFPEKFSCHNATSVGLDGTPTIKVYSCKNLQATVKMRCGFALVGFNAFFFVVTFYEAIYLIRKVVKDEEFSEDGGERGFWRSYLKGKAEVETDDHLSPEDTRDEDGNERVALLPVSSPVDPNQQPEALDRTEVSSEDKMSESTDFIKRVYEAVASVTKESDKKEEMLMMVAPYANWGEYLVPAPLSIALLGELILISGDTDFSLEKKPPENGFQFLNYPNSLRECLVQVSRAGWDAFNSAHTNMDEIRLQSANVDGHVRNAVKLLIGGSNEGVEQMVPEALKNVRKIADGCVSLVVSVEGKFLSVMKLMAELLEACINAQGQYEEDPKAAEVGLAIAREHENTARLQKENAQKQYEYMTKETEDNQKMMKEAVESMPSGWDMIGMSFVEGISNAATGFPGPQMSKVQLPAQAGTSAVEAAIQNAHMKVDTAKQLIKDPQGRYDSAVKALKERNDELRKVLADLTKFDMKTINFEKIRETLIKSIKALAKVRELWGELVLFFQTISNPTTISLTELIESTKAGQTLALEGVSLSNLMRDTIYEQALQASKIAYVVQMISETYVEISNQHLMDRITCLDSLLALDPKKDEAEILRKTMEFHRGCKDAQEAIGQLVMEKKRDFEEQMDKRVAAIESGLKDVLPPRSEAAIEESKAIIKGALKSVKEDDLEQFA